MGDRITYAVAFGKLKPAKRQASWAQTIRFINLLQIKQTNVTTI